jgi:hypothetical protein
MLWFTTVPVKLAVFARWPVVRALDVEARQPIGAATAATRSSPLVLDAAALPISKASATSMMTLR